MLRFRAKLHRLRIKNRAFLLVDGAFFNFYRGGNQTPIITFQGGRTFPDAGKAVIGNVGFTAGHNVSSCHKKIFGDPVILGNDALEAHGFSFIFFRFL